VKIKITRSPGSDPLPSDDCADCGNFMNSVMVGRDKIRRCITCGTRKKKG
jgi:hypothetical protein